MNPHAIDPSRYVWVIPAVWLAWMIYWRVSSFGTRTTVRRESVGSRVSHIVPLIVGAFLIGVPQSSGHWATLQWVHWSPVLYWSGVGLLGGGLGFTVWARVHLGRNWSGTVTLKEGHELIRSGPYGWVRHPIYTGLLVALLGCAIARGAVGSLIGVAICVAALIRKLRIEERWMGERFGAEYTSYSNTTAALLPLLF